MISAQVDELRELATRCDELQVGAVKAVTMPSDMGSILRDAADTIWQLRDDLQRANAENTKLRSELESVGTAAYLYGRSDLKAENARLRSYLSDDVENARMIMGENSRLREQNAKLRELVQGLWFAAQYLGMNPDGATGSGFARQMRELGVEVPT